MTFAGLPPTEAVLHMPLFGLIGCSGLFRRIKRFRVVRHEISYWLSVNWFEGNMQHICGGCRLCTNAPLRETHIGLRPRLPSLLSSMTHDRRRSTKHQPSPHSKISHLSITQTAGVMPVPVHTRITFVVVEVLRDGKGGE